MARANPDSRRAAGRFRLDGSAGSWIQPYILLEVLFISVHFLLSLHRIAVIKAQLMIAWEIKCAGPWSSYVCISLPQATTQHRGQQRELFIPAPLRHSKKFTCAPRLDSTAAESSVSIEAERAEESLCSSESRDILRVENGIRRDKNKEQRKEWVRGT